MFYHDLYVKLNLLFASSHKTCARVSPRRREKLRDVKNATALVPK